MNVCMTGLILVSILFATTYLGKRQIEPFAVPDKQTFDVLLDNYLRPYDGYIKLVNYGELNKYIATSPMASYAQITNNKQYWSNPENGTALYPSINGKALYE